MFLYRVQDITDNFFLTNITYINAFHNILIYFQHCWYLWFDCTVLKCLQTTCVNQFSGCRFQPVPDDAPSQPVQGGAPGEIPLWETQRALHREASLAVIRRHLQVRSLIQGLNFCWHLQVRSKTLGHNICWHLQVRSLRLSFNICQHLPVRS